jgi:hypothetical protein
VGGREGEGAGEGGRSREAGREGEGVGRVDLHTSPWIFIPLPGSCANKIVAARIFFEQKGKEREQARKGRK